MRLRCSLCAFEWRRKNTPELLAIDEASSGATTAGATVLLKPPFSADINALLLFNNSSVEFAF